MTLLDLPTECLKAVLRRMPDHEGLLVAATAHQALSDLVDGENSLWKVRLKLYNSLRIGSLEINGS